MVASLTLQCNLIWNDVMCRFSARPSPSLSSHIGGRPGSFIQGQQVRRRRPAKPRLPRPRSCEPHANQHRRLPARPPRPPQGCARRAGHGRKSCIPPPMPLSSHPGTKQNPHRGWTGTALPSRLESDGRAASGSTGPHGLFSLPRGAGITLIGTGMRGPRGASIEDVSS